MLAKKKPRGDQKELPFTPQPLPAAQEGQGSSSVSESLLKCLTPNTRRGTAVKLKNMSPSSRPTRAIRKEIGLNLSKQFSPPNRDGSTLCQEVKAFFDQDEITTLCLTKSR